VSLTRQILVVEDEFLIAMKLEQTLRRAGYQVVGPAAGVGMALGLLRQVRPDAAVLDVNLAGERVTPAHRPKVYTKGSARKARTLPHNPTR
jgi:DNA-binding response OmpR family regulator